MKRKFPLFLLGAYIVMCFASCSGSEDEISLVDKENPDEDQPEISLAVTKQDLKLFEMTQLEILYENLWYDTYDSIKWDISDVFERKSIPTHFLHAMSQTFYLPGEYKVSLKLYKNGKILSGDSTIIKVQLTGDFLGVEWNNAKERTGFSNFKSHKKEFNLTLNYVQGEDPYAILIYQPDMDFTWNNGNWVRQDGEGRQFYYDYITNLYGKSVFNYEDADINSSPLRDEYNRRFKKPLSSIDGISYIPVAIWDAEKSHIALVVYSLELSTGTYKVYNIIAEPRKF